MKRILGWGSMDSRYLILKEGEMYYLLQQFMEGRIIYSGWREIYSSIHYDTVLEYYERSGLEGEFIDEVGILETFGMGLYG